MTATLPRVRLGLNLSLKHYFALQADLRHQCGMETPDVIYLNGSDRDVSNYGYVLVYNQTGFVRTEPHGLKEPPQPAEAFIAVRADLIPAVAPTPLAAVDFGALEDDND